MIGRTGRKNKREDDNEEEYSKDQQDDRQCAKNVCSYAFQTFKHTIIPPAVDFRKSIPQEEKKCQ